MLRTLAKRLYGSPYILLTLTVLFWSGNFVLGRAVRLDVPPIGLAFWRWTLGLLIILPFAWGHLRRDWPELLRRWKIVLFLSATGVAAFNAIIYSALHETTAVNALLMQSAMPVVIVALGFVVFRERVTLRQSFGIAVSLTGAVTVIAKGSFSMLLSLDFNRGDLWVAAAVVIYAAYSAFLRKRPRVHGLSFIAVTFALGVVMLFPFYMREIFQGGVMELSRVTVLSVLYVAVFPSVLSYLFFNRGVELAGANKAGMFIHLMPLFGGGLAVVFLGESPRLFHAFGLVLILGGIYFVTRR